MLSIMGLGTHTQADRTLDVDRLRTTVGNRLDSPLLRLFTDLTGLRCGVLFPGDGNRSLLPCRERPPELDAGSAKRTSVARKPPCDGCVEAHLGRACASGGKGHRFSCAGGLRNHWLPIEVRQRSVAVLVLQEEGNGRSSSGRKHLRAPHGADAEHEPARLRHRKPASGAGSDAFSRGIRLLRLVAHDISRTLLAEADEQDLQRAQVRALHHEAEANRLRRELHRRLPEASLKPATPRDQDRHEQLLRQSLAFIHANYRRPMQLRDLAEHLRLTDTYVSHFFSAGMGMSFKHCLTELRLEKAKALLADPRLQVAEIAGAVGYADANRFRAAFKEATGLSPTAWREAFRPA